MTLLVAAALTMQVGNWSSAEQPPSQGAETAEPVVSPEDVKFFESQVRPILAESCYRCHGEKFQRGKLRLDSRAATLAGGESGPAVVVGKPDESSLIDAINYKSFEMPPDAKLSDEKIAALTEWVRRGAPWPKSTGAEPHGKKQRVISDEERAYWCFQPLHTIAPPTVDDQGWSRNAVDRFIYQKLVDAGLRPSPEADRRALIRRAYFDLIGLPPTATEIDEFTSDTSDHAFEKVIDRLLESPRYGERWGRHWLDLVRYAESDGFKQDAYRPEAWRYRDYVIRSLNDDKPYDQFVVEQIAGDEIAPSDPTVIPATSYLRHWIYEYNQRDVRTQWHNILNDVTDVTAEVFLGVSLGCARCHDHKFDPLLQKDYFQFQAFFSPLLPRDDLMLGDQASLNEYREKLAAWEAKTAEIRREMAELERPVRQVVADAAINKFPPEIRPMMRKAREERDSYEHQLAELAFRQVNDELDKIDFPKKLKGEAKEKWETLKKELSAFDADKPKKLPPAFTVTDVSAKAPPTRILGDKKHDEFEPGLLTVLGGERPAIVSPAANANSTGRRLALAKWIADAKNPLSTRVIVNRIWQYHFGRGIVGSSSDFGKLGDQPSHPELLDWLANDFTQNGWKLKRFHRMLLTSATYRQAATTPINELTKVKDPENRLLWRMTPRRLDGEQIRDAFLLVSGELDSTSTGPAGDHNSFRRTIFTQVLRNKPEPLMEVFDGPDGFNSTSQRDVTTTPTQSLLMINGPWTNARAASVAKTIVARSNHNVATAVETAYRSVLGRSPQPQESDRAASFIQFQAEQSKEQLAASVPLGPALSGQSGGTLLFQENSGPPCRLQVRNKSMLPPGDFTVEAYVLLKSLYSDASVRTIASQWDGNKKHIGWALGVTSKQSALKPSNLILQLVSTANDDGYEVVASNLFLETGKAYYVAARVQMSGSDPAKVTFFVRDLAGGELKTVDVACRGIGPFVGESLFTLGGRDGETNHAWDGQLDEVRLSNVALAPEKLLLKDNAVATSTVGFWRFDEATKWNRDTSPAANDVESTSLVSDPTAYAELAAITDLCHVLMNSNEFLYVD